MVKGEKNRMVIKIALSVVALLLIAGVSVFIKIKYEQSKMRPLDTGEIIPDIFAVKNSFVNFYLIKSGDQYIAVDAGANRATTEDELRTLGISSDDVVAVLITHAHGDHTGAVDMFGNAAVYVGKNGTTSRITEYEVLSDGDSIELLGTSIQCINTPGHTDGSVCYLIDGKYLFVGDTLSLQNNQVNLFNSFYNKSDKTQADSILKLAALKDVQYVFSAHYGFADNAIFPIESR